MNMQIATMPEINDSELENQDDFAAALGLSKWLKLLPAIQKRFTANRKDIVPRIYNGKILHTERNIWGWCLSQVSRLLGSPLPLQDGAKGEAATVTLTDNPGLGGKVWTRIYHQEGKFPQAIHSTKKFGGPTGMREQIYNGIFGYFGLGMNLQLDINNQGTSLYFKDRGYFFTFGNATLPLPHWVPLPHILVTHEDLGYIEKGSFYFELDVTHDWFGRILFQKCIFQDMEITQ